MLVVGALGAVGADVVWSAVALTVLASGATGVLLQRLLATVSPPLVALAVALFWVTSRTSFAYIGMETNTLLMLHTLFLLLMMTGRPCAGALVGALACLTRPDGLVLVGPVLLLTRGARSPRCLAWFALPGLAWLLFARVYYHDWLPNSFHAKQGLTEFGDSLASLAGQLRRFPFGDGAVDLGRLVPSLLGASLLNAAMTGLVLLDPMLRRARPLLFAILVYPWLLIFLYAKIGPPRGHNWEIQSAVFFNQLALALGVATGLRIALARVRQRLPAVEIPALALFGVAVALLYTVNLRQRLDRPVYDQQARWNGARHRTYLHIAKWADANLPAGTSLAYYEVGTIAYYSQLGFIDMAHIVTRGQPAGPPDLLLREGDVAETTMDWGTTSLPYRRVHRFPDEGFHDFSLLARDLSSATHPQGAQPSGVGLAGGQGPSGMSRITGLRLRR